MKNLFNSKINIEYSTKTADAYGSHTIVWAIKHSDVACRINWLNGSERIYLDKNTWVRDARIYCGVINISIVDRVLYLSKIYEIVNFENPDENGKFLVIDIKIKE